MRTKLTLGAISILALIITVILVPIVSAQERTPVNALEVAAFYHADVNDTVNQRLQIVAEQMDLISENPEIRPLVRARFVYDSDADCKETTAEKLNLSVNCLLLNLKAKNDQFKSDLKKFGLPNVDSTNIKALGNAEEQKAALITYLDTQADDLLDQVLDAYSQVILANIMHAENLNTIAKIETLQDSLSDLKDTVSDLPANFINVSTTQCR